MSFNAIIPGRILETCISFGSSTDFRYNVHNFALSHSDRTVLQRRTEHTNGLAKADPALTAVVMRGDFNLCSSCDSAIEISSRLPSQPKNSQLNQGKLFKPILDNLVYFESPLRCNYHAESNTVSCIDRFYVGAPSFVVQVLSFKALSIRSPVKMSV